MHVKTGKYSSIGTRFSVIQIAIVSILLVIFTAVLMVVNITRIERALEDRLAGYFSHIRSDPGNSALESGLCASIDNYVDALFLDDSIVFVQVWSDDSPVATRARETFQDRDFAFSNSRRISSPAPQISPTGKPSSARFESRFRAARFATNCF
jgi:hypothetical protein